MVKVLNSSIITHQVECNNCDSILEYIDSDVVENKICCPKCEAFIELFDEKILTIENIIFPSDFYDFSNGKPISDEEINKWIKKCLKSCLEDEADYGVYNYISSGDTFVLVLKFDNEYEIVVGKKHYTANIER